jgi:hypothetical protein
LNWRRTIRIEGLSSRAFSATWRFKRSSSETATIDTAAVTPAARSDSTSLGACG